ncbi:hypothetical protein ABZ297_28015, partial [Nonomuraea sp. NPDC005983]|uniref:hypothetical protein n=1 Tax=Nonomuraea sp. NPDC005983 TaxID=3155595 RepID=UPI0033A2B944
MSSFIEQLTRNRPSGLNATSSMGEVWPVSVAKGVTSAFDAAVGVGLGVAQSGRLEGFAPGDYMVLTLENVTVAPTAGVAV